MDEDGNEIICDDTIGCSKNSDCDDWCKAGEKCFCAISADETGKDSACYNNFTGQCAVAISPSDDADEYTVSGYAMTWWSAVNFCKAHNKSLVSLSDLGINGGYQDDAECFGSDCTGTFKWGIANNGLPDDFWVADAAKCDIIESEWKTCRAGENNKSCKAFIVYQSPEVVYPDFRSHDGSQSAVCKK